MLQKVIDHGKKIKREFLLVERIQQMEFESVISVDATIGNDPMIQQRVVTMTCCKCGQKGHYGKDFPSSTGTILVAEQNVTYSPPATVIQSSLVVILRELVKPSRPTNNQEKVFNNHSQNRLPPAQTAVTKLTMTPKAVTAKPSAIGKKTV